MSRTPDAMESVKRSIILIVSAALAGYGLVLGYLALRTSSPYVAANALFYVGGIILLGLPLVAWRAIPAVNLVQRILKTGLVSLLAGFVFVYVVMFVVLNTVGA